MATKKSVAMTPTKAPSNGVNCTSTAVEEAARHTKGTKGTKGVEREDKNTMQNQKSEIGKNFRRRFGAV